MSKQSTELEKIETKESFLEKTVKDALSKTIAILLSGGAIAVISMFVALVYGLPYYFYLPLGAFAFCLTSLGFYLFSFRRTNKILRAEIESLIEQKNEIALLENPELEKEVAKLRKELETKQILYERLQVSNKDDKKFWENAHKTEIKPLKEKLLQKQWLFSIANYQAENIGLYVKLQKNEAFYANSDTSGQDIPFIAFRLAIVNNSIFEIAVEINLEGEILFKGKPLLGQKQVWQPPNCLEPTEREILIIHQRLSSEEIKFINDGLENYKAKTDLREPNFQFGNLKITVKGSEKFPQVKTKTIVIERDVEATLKELQTNL